MKTEYQRLRAYILDTMPDGYGGHDIHELAAKIAAANAGSEEVEPNDDDYLEAALQAWDLASGAPSEPGPERHYEVIASVVVPAGSIMGPLRVTVAAASDLLDGRLADLDEEARDGE